MPNNDNVHASPRPSRPLPPDSPGPLRAAGSFVAHYVEMVAAMLAGMIVLHPLWDHVVPGDDVGGLARSLEVDTLLMATSMSIPMVAWMRLRGHGWLPALEMSAAMYAGFVVLYPAWWAGALGESAVETYGHLLMLVFMLLAMLARRCDYTGTGGSL